MVEYNKISHKPNLHIAKYTDFCEFPGSDIKELKAVDRLTTEEKTVKGG